MSIAFPSQPFNTAANCVEAYRQEIIAEWAGVDGAALEAAAAKVRAILAGDGAIHAQKHGVFEDMHQLKTHLPARYLYMLPMDPADVGQRIF